VSGRLLSRDPSPEPHPFQKVLWPLPGPVPSGRPRPTLPRPPVLVGRGAQALAVLPLAEQSWASAALRVCSEVIRLQLTDLQPLKASQVPRRGCKQVFYMQAQKPNKVAYPHLHQRPQFVPIAPCPFAISQADGSSKPDLGKRLRAKEPNNSVCRGSSFLEGWGAPPLGQVNKLRFIC